MENSLSTDKAPDRYIFGRHLIAVIAQKCAFGLPLSMSGETCLHMWQKGDPLEDAALNPFVPTLLSPHLPPKLSTSNLMDFI